MSWLLFLIHLLLLTWLTLKLPWFRTGIIPAGYRVIILFAKIAAAILGGYLYMWKYGGGDTWGFFKDGMIIKYVISKDPSSIFAIFSNTVPEGKHPAFYFTLANWLNYDSIYNDNRTVIMTHALLGFISFNSYYINAAWFAFFSFAGLTGIADLLSNRNQCLKNKFWMLAFFLAPSALFFLSVAGKESLAIFSTGLVLGSFKKIMNRNFNFAVLIVFIFGLLLACLIKMYIILLLIPACIALLLSGNKAYPVRTFLSVYTITIICVACIGIMVPEWDIKTLLYNKRMAFISFANAQPDSFKSLVNIPLYENSWSGVISAAPSALFISAIEPFVFAGSNLMLGLLSAENLVLTLTLLLSIIIIFKQQSWKTSSEMVFCLFFILSLYTLIGLTTPVAGAIVRYKSVAIPLIIFLAANAWNSRHRSGDNLIP